MNYELFQSSECSNRTVARRRDRLIAKIPLILCIVFIVVIIILAASRHSVPAPVPSASAPVPTTPAPVPSALAPVPSAPAPVPSTPTPVPPAPVPVPPTPAPVLSTTAPVPAASAPVPSTHDPVPSAPAPVTSTPAPVPTAPVPVPPTTAPVPTTTAPVPYTLAPVPSDIVPVPPTSAPVPSTTAPVPSAPAPVQVPQHRCGKEEHICTSEECIRSAADIILSMNTSVDPCDDFYRFTCDRWSSVHLDFKWFSEDSGFTIVEDKLSVEYIKVLKSSDTEDESKPVHQSRAFFDSCLNQEVRDKIAYKPVFKLLSQLGLPAVPRFFNTSESQEDIETYKFDWIKTEAAMNKLLNIQLIVDCDVIVNMYNTSRNTIRFNIPEKKVFGEESFTISKIQHNKLLAVEESLAINNNSENNTTEKTYSSFMYNIMSTLISEKYYLPEDFDEKFYVAADAIYDIERQLKNKKAINYMTEDHYIIRSINQIQNYTDDFLKRSNFTNQKKIWKIYLQQLFDGMNVSLDLDNKDTIQMQSVHIDYYVGVVGLLVKELDAKIELWYWWNAVKNLMIHTTSKVKYYQDKLFVSTTGAEKNPTREISCASLAKTYMDYAVASALVKESFLNTTKPKVENMWHNIKNAFEIRVNAITWMNQDMKMLTIEKIRAMSDFIGFPEWLLDKDEVEKFYSGLTISDNTYLDNLVELTKFKRKNTLQRLHLINKKDWDNNPLDVNAYYNILGNYITIPWGIINYPFYNRGLDVLNYASLGSILGHELTHGFDNTGRKFNKLGNYEMWWSNSAIDEFYLKAFCFENLYKSFYIPEVNASINGLITLGENLADNGGLHQAYLAYQKHKELIGEENKLPGLEKYTSDQLFFISFGNIWCEEEKVANLKLSLNVRHCPNKYRLLGNLMNSKEFVKAFNCPVGSKMNPSEQKCEIW